MTVRPRGRRCRCGAQGCWETEIGSPAIARALGLAEHTATEDLLAALAAADDAGTLLATVGEFLGLGLASLINMVNPRLIVVGGMLGHVYAAIEPQVTEEMRRSALVAPMEQVRVVVPQLGDDASLVGAAELAWTDLLADPTAVLGTPQRQLTP
jgi:predicted NBD/HSP70 family sugar kinase